MSLDDCNKLGASTTISNFYWKIYNNWLSVLTHVAPTNTQNHGFCYTLPPTQHHSFFRNLPPFITRSHRTDRMYFFFARNTFLFLSFHVENLSWFLLFHTILYFQAFPTKQSNHQVDCVAVLLSRNRSQMTSKCGKRKKVAHEALPSASLIFFPHFAFLCDLLLDRRTATWNIFVLYDKEDKCC